MNEEYGKGWDIPPIPFAYIEWKRYGRHLKEYASELVGTAYLIFCIIGWVALVSAPASPISHLLPWPCYGYSVQAL